MSIRTEYPETPRLAVGAVVVHQDRVLLVLRAKAPSKGLWAIPGGSVHLGETMAVAAEREVWEETGLRIKAGDVIHAFDAIHYDDNDQLQFHYVIIDLMAQLRDPMQTIIPGDDALDAAWFTAGELVDLALSPPTRDLLQRVMKADD